MGGECCSCDITELKSFSLILPFFFLFCSGGKSTKVHCGKKITVISFLFQFRLPEFINVFKKTPTLWKRTKTFASLVCMVLKVWAAVQCVCLGTFFEHSEQQKVKKLWLCLKIRTSLFHKVWGTEPCGTEEEKLTFYPNVWSMKSLISLRFPLVRGQDIDGVLVVGDDGWGSPLVASRSLTSTKTAWSGLINCRSSLFWCRASTLAKISASVLIKDPRLERAHSWGS